FSQGFEALHNLIPDVVGDCKDDEHVDPSTGNSIQQTTNGILAWRKKDNVTIFTNGQTTWLRGPCGLQSRPDNEQLPWERGDPQPCSGIYGGEPGAVNLTVDDLGGAWVMSNQKLEGGIRVNQTPVAVRHTAEFRYGFGGVANFSPGGASFIRGVVTVFREPALAEYMWPKMTTASDGYNVDDGVPQLGDSWWLEFRDSNLGGGLGAFTDLHYVVRYQNVMIEVFITGQRGRVDNNDVLSLAQLVVQRIDDAEKPPPEEQPAEEQPSQ